MKTKACCTCAEKKSVDLFFRNRTTDDGFSRQCRACCKQRKQQRLEEEARLGYHEALTAP